MKNFYLTRVEKIQGIFIKNNNSNLKDLVELIKDDL